MAQFPGLTIWTDAYLADTSHLSTLEHGAYLLLLFAAWRSKECSLPNDDKLLARYARMRIDHWLKIKPIIMEFFEIENGRLIQGRLQDEKSYISQRSNVNSKNAKARWLKTNDKGDATASDPHSERNSPTPTPTPIVKEVKEKIGSPVSQKLVEVFEFYQEFAASLNLTVPRGLADKYQKVLRARIKQVGGIEEMKVVIRKIADSDFLLGRVKGRVYQGRQMTPFKMELSRLCDKEDFFLKVWEGGFDDKKKTPPPKPMKVANVVPEPKINIEDHGGIWNGDRSKLDKK